MADLKEIKMLNGCILVESPFVEKKDSGVIIPENLIDKAKNEEVAKAATGWFKVMAVQDDDDTIKVGGFIKLKSADLVRVKINNENYLCIQRYDVMIYSLHRG